MLADGPSDNDYSEITSPQSFWPSTNQFLLNISSSWYSSNVCEIRVRKLFSPAEHTLLSPQTDHTVVTSDIEVDACPGGGATSYDQSDFRMVTDSLDRSNGASISPV